MENRYRVGGVEVSVRKRASHSAGGPSERVCFPLVIKGENQCVRERTDGILKYVCVNMCVCPH